MQQGKLSPDPAKVSTVAACPTPSTCKQLQCFLGFANFYSRFIHDYSKVVALLTQITLTRKPFQWSEEAEAAFFQLKVLFTSIPILSHPDPDRQFTVKVDNSDVGVSVVLHQQDQADQKLHPCPLFGV